MALTRDHIPGSGSPPPTFTITNLRTTATTMSSHSHSPSTLTRRDTSSHSATRTPTRGARPTWTSCWRVTRTLSPEKQSGRAFRWDKLLCEVKVLRDLDCRGGSWTWWRSPSPSWRRGRWGRVWGTSRAARSSGGPCSSWPGGICRYKMPVCLLAPYIAQVHTELSLAPSKPICINIPFYQSYPSNPIILILWFPKVPLKILSLVLDKANTSGHSPGRAPPLTWSRASWTSSCPSTRSPRSSGRSWYSRY